MRVSHGSAERSPRSDHGFSPRNSARGRSLDMDLRNAPSYHAAIMRLLPSSVRRAITQRHPATGDLDHCPSDPLHPPHPQRECLCDKDRKHYRKDWLPEHTKGPPCATLSSSPLAPLSSPSSLPSPRRSTHLLCASTSLAEANHSFKSGTVYLEVKLAELLSKHKREFTAHPVPDARCLRVCWQLLGELSKMKTPFAQTFSTIFKELNKSIHSPYVAALGDNTKSAFYCVPYFELINKLGHRKSEIENERKDMEIRVLEWQDEIGHVAKEIQVSHEKLLAAEDVGRGMEEKLSTILDDLEGIINQVRTLQEEVSNLKSKMQNARVEECKAREVQYEQMVRKEQYAKLEENYNSMLQDLQEAQAALDTARHEAIESVPKEELGDAKMKVNELQKILSELQAKADDQIATSGELTPRPAWGDLLPSTGHDYSEKHTAELLVDICKHNVYLTHNISQLHEDCSIAQASVFEVPLKKGLPKNRGMDDVSESKGTPRSEAKRIINENKKSQEASRSSTKSKKK